MASAFHARGGRGFTLVELLLVLVVVTLLVVVFLPTTNHHGGINPAVKCSANIRGIGMGLALFAQSNKDQYPLPSVLDAANATINAVPASKDPTANIISTLIYGTFFGPEICVSPAETNGKINMCNDYSYSAPPTAVDPKLAVWDPNFSADFTSAKGGSVSYAHMLPSGPRAAKWANTFEAARAVIGNRGPLFTGVTKGKGGKVTPQYDSASNTMLIHGPRTTWEGNIAYNDNHVNYETSLWGDDTITYTDTGGVKWPDMLHYDEPDDKAGTNNYMGIFTTSGSTPGEFKSIWD